MKKLLVVVATFAFISIQVNAQDFKFGVKGGVNFANFYGKDVKGTDMRTSFHVGVVGEYQFREQFAFQPELLFSAQGAKVNDAYIEEIDDNADLTFKLSYITLPLIFKFYASPEFTLEFGPQISFLVDSKGEFETNDLSVEGDIEDIFKTVDFGLNFGLGYKFNENIFANARYNLGLSKIDDKEDAKVKNSVIQISVGYMF